MSVEYRFFGFFESENPSELESIITDEQTHDECDSYGTVSEKAGKLFFSVGDDGAYEAWSAIHQAVSEQIAECQNYLIITYCDLDDDGCPAEGKISGKTYSGYIGLSEYFDIADECDHNSWEIVDVVWEKLCHNELKLKTVDHGY